MSVNISPEAARIIAERQRVRDAAPASLSAKITGPLELLSNADLKCIVADLSWSADGDRRERAALVLQNRLQKEFWHCH